MNKVNPQIDEIYKNGIKVNNDIEQDKEENKLKVLLLTSLLLGNINTNDDVSLYSNNNFYDWEQEVDSVLNAMSRSHKQKLKNSLVDTYIKAHPQGLTPTKEEISKVLNNKTFNRTFVDSINKHTKKLKRTIIKSVQDGSSVNYDYMKLQESIDKRFRVYSNEMKALVRTETQSFINQSRLNAYKKQGFKEYIYIAVVDERTTAICLSLNGTVHKLEDGVVGSNMPPMHTNCRSEIYVYDSEER